MSYIIIRTIDIFFQVLELLIVVDAMLSWFYAGKKNKWVIQLRSLVEPILIPFRKLVALMKINMGMVDFSPILALLFIEFLVKPIILNIAVRLLT